MKRPGSWVGTLAFLTVCVAALAFLRLGFGRVADTPEPFAGRISLRQALAESRSSGKPVLALATADWCGPCQSLKRGALADDAVQRWVEQNTVPVYVDLTSDRDPAAQEAAQMLMISAVPALVLIDEGGIVARKEGVIDADALLAWLEAAAESAATPSVTTGG